MKELPDIKSTADMDISIKSTDGANIFSEGTVDLKVDEIILKKPSEKHVRDIPAVLIYAVNYNLESKDIRVDKADLKIRELLASLKGDIKNLKTSPAVNIAVNIPKSKAADIQNLAALFSDLKGLVLAGEIAADIRIATPMAAPAWAMLERELLRFNSEAVERFARKYLDERGYLLHTPRWGTLDGPDDAIGTYWNWTLLHTLGGSEAVLELYKKAQEGHWKQYGELRTRLTELAGNGAYCREFITQSDWFHIGEGMRAFLLLGLSDPNNEIYRQRTTRFAAMYMGDDQDAPNYDPVHKVIKSIWTGSKGPMLRKATAYDWVGDPVPGIFHLLHNPAGRGKMLDLQANYEKMLAH